MFTTGPFTLALTTPVTPRTLDIPSGHGAHGVLINNQSPYTCSVDIAGPREWLQPWESHLYLLDPSGAAPIVAAQSSVLTAAFTGAQLLATWIDTAAEIPGTYPVPLSGAAIAGTVNTQVPAVLLGTGTVTGGGNQLTFGPFSPPAGFHGLLITSSAVQPAGTYTEILVVGGITGQIKWFVGEILGLRPLVVPVNSDLGTTVSVLGQTPAGGVADTIKIFAVGEAVQKARGMPMHTASTNATLATLATPLTITIGNTSKIHVVSATVSAGAGAAAAESYLTNAEANILNVFTQPNMSDSVSGAQDFESLSPITTVTNAASFRAELQFYYE